MKRDFKAHPLSNIMLFVSCLAAFMIIISCLSFGENYRQNEQEKNRQYSIICMIKTLEKELSCRQVSNVLQEFDRLQKKYSLGSVELTDLADNEVTGWEKAAGQENGGMIGSIQELFNRGEICFVIRDDQPLQEVYRDFYDQCQKNGFEICVNKHKEVSERHTKEVNKRLYILIRGAAICFSFILIFGAMYLWYGGRKHEWFIRNIYGQSAGCICMDVVKIHIMFMIMAYLLSVLGVRMFGGVDSTGLSLVRYGLLGVGECVLCSLLLGIQAFKFSNIFR